MTRAQSHPEAVWKSTKAAEYVELIDGRYRIVERFAICRPMEESKEDRARRVKEGKPVCLVEYTACRIVPAFR